MTPRERQLAAIRHEVPDRIPADCICIELVEQLYSRFGARSYPEVLLKLELDGWTIAAGYVGPSPKADDGTQLTEWGFEPDWVFLQERRRPLAGATSTAQIERYPWPSADRYDYAAAAALAREWGDRLCLRGPYWVPLFTRVCGLVGMEETMINTLAEPALFEAALEHVYQWTAEYCTRLLEACGDAMPVLSVADDFATQRGMMISPALWRKYVKPRQARIFEIGKKAGKVIWFHSCGNILEVLPDLIDMGMDVWETVQLHTLPISPRELKGLYGRHVTFFGGVNTQRLPFLTPQEVRGETLRCLEALGEGGGYICGPDHHVKPDVPMENCLALFDTIKGFRREGYTA